MLDLNRAEPAMNSTGSWKKKDRRIIEIGALAVNVI